MTLEKLEKMHNETLKLIHDNCDCDISNDDVGCTLATTIHLIADSIDIAILLSNRNVYNVIIRAFVELGEEIYNNFDDCTQKREILACILAHVKTIESMRNKLC